ncbi:MAG: hypothetical protein ACXU86_02525 [Archangium sp.]
MFQIDGSGQRFVEVPLTDSTEKIRATIVHNGSRGPVAVRLQIKDETGHLRQGPEVAVKDFAALNQELFTALATAIQP